jgi:hypothetical protein
MENIEALKAYISIVVQDISKHIDVVGHCSFDS